jgi:type IV pilus assembly protein PilC
MIYAYAAVDGAGARVKGILDAKSADEVIADLLERSLTPVTVEPQHSSLAGLTDLGRFISVPVDTQLLFFEGLAFMLHQAIPIRSALRVSIERCQHKQYATALRAVLSDVENGVDLWRAMERRPREFTPMQIAMVRVGEKSGALPDVLESIAIMLDNSYGVAKDVKNALVNPAIIFAIGLGAIVLLFVTVVPRMKEFLAALHTPLPGPTKVVLALSDFLTHPLSWIVLVGGGVLFAMGFRAAMRNADFAYRVDKLVARTPIAGALIRQIVVARVARMLATLLRAGVPQPHALELIVPLSGPQQYRRGIEQIKADVEEGKSLTSSFERAAVFDPMLVQMIGVGEESGGLTDMLLKVATYLDRETRKKLEALTKLIEPIMSVIIGSMVGAVLIALYLPYYSMLGAFTNGLSGAAGGH